MAILKIPSLQHLARNCHETVPETKAAFLRLALNPPVFNYGALATFVQDMLLLQQPQDELIQMLRLKESRPAILKNFLEIAALIGAHFKDVVPNYVHPVPKAYYPIGQNLRIPFEPLLVYGLNGKLFYPWFSFWRSNPLAAKRLSLFVTIVEEMLLKNPDFDGARFEILDFSAPSPKKPRELTIIDSADVPRLGNDEKTAILETCVQGFLEASAELAKRPDQSRGKEKVLIIDPNQTSLFDGNDD